MLTETKTITEIANNSTSLISQLITGYNNYKDLHADHDAYIRLIYLEVINNLEVLETINLDKLKNIEFNDPAFKDLINQLSTEVMSGVFVPEGKKNAKLYTFLNKKGTIKSFAKSDNDLIEGEKKDIKKKEINTTVLKSIVFLVTKIETLKRVSNIGEQVFMKELRLKTRLKNIKERLVLLKSTLREFDKLEGIA